MLQLIQIVSALAIVTAFVLAQAASSDRGRAPTWR